MPMEGKFWLISDEDVNEIRLGLESASHDTNDSNCPDGWTVCKGCNGQIRRKLALHALDSGLHLTDEQPTG